MFYNGISIVFFLIGIWGFIFTHRNKNNMPFFVFGVKEKQCEIVNKKEFNNIMMNQSFFISACFILMAVTVYFSKSSISNIYLGFIILAQVIFSQYAKKHIKMNDRV